MAAPQFVSNNRDIVMVLQAGSSEIAGDFPPSLDAKVRAVLATLRRETKGNEE